MLTFRRVAAFCLWFAVCCSAAWADQESPVLLEGGAEDSRTFSRLTLSANAYVINDRDFVPEQPEMGLFTTWVYEPIRGGRFEVIARYCIPDRAGEIDQTLLRQIDLIDQEQVLVSLTERVGALPSRQVTVRPAYYEQPMPRISYAPRFTLGGRVAYVPVYVPQAPIYRPAITCTSGTSGFDLASLADKLTGLPDRTLRVRLTFSNGSTSGWQLGGGTVRELKRLVSVRKELGG